MDPINSKKIITDSDDENIDLIKKSVIIEQSNKQEKSQVKQDNNNNNLHLKEDNSKTTIQPTKLNGNGNCNGSKLELTSKIKNQINSVKLNNTSNKVEEKSTIKPKINNLATNTIKKEQQKEDNNKMLNKKKEIKKKIISNATSSYSNESSSSFTDNNESVTEEYYDAEKIKTLSKPVKKIKEKTISSATKTKVNLNKDASSKKAVVTQSNKQTSKISSNKEDLVFDLLKRWWYVIDVEWYKTKSPIDSLLSSNGLRQVNLSDWKMEDNVINGLKKCIQMKGTPYVFFDCDEKIHDLRNKENCPSYNNLIKKVIF